MISILSTLFSVFRISQVILHIGRFFHNPYGTKNIVCFSFTEEFVIYDTVRIQMRSSGLRES